MNITSTPYRRTKIICTIGPSTSSASVIKELLKTGMDVARINFSHGTHEEHTSYIKTLRQAAKRANLPLAILQDLPGPKNRTGKLKRSTVELKADTDFVLTTRQILGDEHKVSVGLPELPNIVKPGDMIFLDDGIIELKVKSISNMEVNCQVITGGSLAEDRGVNIPGITWDTSTITEEDWAHLLFGLKHNVDLVALSFIREANDVLKVRNFIQKKKKSPVLIAKIERREALDNLDEILEAADGAMVARGDLGIEIPIQRVPIVQKEIIQKCNRLGKPVIVATQMLESMVHALRPTRAEVTDVANAILDGSDALMLSEETAIGNYPVETVSMMAQIALEAEASLPYEEILVNKGKDLQPQTDDAISYAACHAAHQLGAAAIIAFTSSGSTARRVAKYRPGVPILAITPSNETRRQLSICWGVRAFQIPEPSKITALFARGARVAKRTGLAQDGDLVVITGGIPLGVSGKHQSTKGGKSLMIATVTLNPSLDRTVTVEELVMDEANRWTSLRRDPGGKGINVSRVIHELRGETVAYGFIGGIDGETLKHLLQQQGVPFDFTPIKGEIRSNFIITDLTTCHQTRIDAPGPHIMRHELQKLVQKVKHISPKPDFLVFAGSVPPAVPADIYRQLIEAAKNNGIKTVLDSDNKWLKEGIKAIPNVIKPNVHEAEELLDKHLRSETAIVKALKLLVDRGIEVAVISRGKEGLIAANGEKALKAIPPQVEVRSTVGAGDSTIAGLVLKLNEGLDIDEACRWAVAAGTAAALTPGTELCRREDVERLLSKVKIKRL